MSTRKRRPGDRPEGRRLRSLDAYNAVTPFIMKDRRDATNFFSDTVEMTGLDRYIRRKRAEGMKGFGFLHIFVAAYVRTVSQRPALNRFVSGKRIFARNDIEVVMTIKKELTTAGTETSIKVAFAPTDTLNEVYVRISEAIEKVRAEDNGTDKTAALVARFPRFFFSFFMWAVRTLDYFGLMPRSLMAVSPFHGSLVLTDLGSLGIPPVWHHLYDFGVVPIFISFGAKRRVNELQADGSVAERKYLDYTVASDERICDGFYFAQSLKYIRSLLRHPEKLEVPPETVIEDVD